LSLDTVQNFFIATARVATIIGSIPVFSGGQVPLRLRTGLAVALSLALFPVVAPLLPDLSPHPAALVVLLGQEALLGLMVGFLARLIFTAVEFGGNIIGYQMGFAAANVFDPQNQHQLSLMSQFQNVIAILFFLSFNVHHLFVRALVDSYRVLPPGRVRLGGDAMPFMLRLGGDMFVLAMKFSAPILAVLLLAGLVLGIMARVFPQLNVFMLSFPLNIGVGFLVIGLTLHLTGMMLGREFHALSERLMYLFELARGGG
jgi:flagellar biosynthetic protein FliR